MQRLPSSVAFRTVTGVIVTIAPPRNDASLSNSSVPSINVVPPRRSIAPPTFVAMFPLNSPPMSVSPSSALIAPPSCAEFVRNTLSVIVNACWVRIAPPCPFMAELFSKKQPSTISPPTASIAPPPTLRLSRNSTLVKLASPEPTKTPPPVPVATQSVIMLDSTVRDPVRT